MKQYGKIIIVPVLFSSIYTRKESNTRERNNVAIIVHDEQIEFFTVYAECPRYVHTPGISINRHHQDKQITTDNITQEGQEFKNSKTT